MPSPVCPPRRMRFSFESRCRIVALVGRMGAHLLQFPDRRAVSVVLPDPGRRKLRMIFRHDDGLRAMCWVTVGSDGSLYFNQLNDTGEKLTFVEAIADGKGGWTNVTPPNRDQSQRDLRPEDLAARLRRGQEGNLPEQEHQLP